MEKNPISDVLPVWATTRIVAMPNATTTRPRSNSLNRVTNRVRLTSFMRVRSLRESHGTAGFFKQTSEPESKTLSTTRSAWIAPAAASTAHSHCFQFRRVLGTTHPAYLIGFARFGSPKHARRVTSVSSQRTRPSSGLRLFPPGFPRVHRDIRRGFGSAPQYSETDVALGALPARGSFSRPQSARLESRHPYRDSLQKRARRLFAELLGARLAWHRRAQKGSSGKAATQSFSADRSTDGLWYTGEGRP